MTSNDPNIRASFQAIDTPVAVDPAFAERVRAAVANLHAEPKPTGGDPIQITTQNPPPATQSAPRLRWQDLAAAAVLVLALAGLITGAIRLMREDQPGKVIAPEVAWNGSPSSPTNRHLFDAGSPVSPFGSPANDGSLPGIAPVAGEYSKLWEFKTNMSWAVIFGDHVYYLSAENEPGHTASVVTLDAATGDELWRQQVNGRAIFAVTSEGVVAGLPGNESNTFRIALLDHWTGEPIWQSDTAYRASDSRFSTLTVSGNLILFLDQEQLVALDLGTGQEHWTHPVPEVENTPCAPEYCTAQIAVSGTTVYIQNDWTNTIEAVDLGTGISRWTRSLPETDLATGTFLPPNALVAVDDGLVISLPDPVQEQGRRIEKWSEQTGETLWTILDYPAGFSFSRSGDELIVPLYWLSDDMLQIDQISIATGERQMSQVEGDPRKLSTLNVLSDDSGAIIGGYRSGWSDPTWAQENIPFFTSIFGEPETHFGLTLLDPATLQAIREVEIDDCLIELPVSITGDVLCREGQSIAVYRPLNPPVIPSPDPAQENLADTSTDTAQADASPTPAAPELADIPVINLSGSAANDGNLPGVMPPPGTTYDLLWEGASLGAETPSRVYSVDSYLVQWIGAAPNGTVHMFDLATGAELWSMEVAPGYPVVVSETGVLVGQQVEDGEAAHYLLVLHDLATGEQIWEAGPFDLNQLGMDSVFVTDTGVYVLDGETNLVALDLGTGSIQWEFDTRQGRSDEEMLGPDCANANPACDRTRGPHALTIWADVAYRYVPLSGELMAINLADGSLRWAHSLTEVSGIAAPEVRLMATELGVIPIVSGLGAADGHYVGMWLAQDGMEQWTKPIEITSAFVFQGALLVVTWTNPESPEDCCPIAAIRLSTGTTTWGEPSLPDLYFVGTFGGSAFQMTETAPVLTDRSPVPVEIVSYAPAGRFTERVTADQVVPGCAAVTPTSTSGYVICHRPDGQIAVYRPSLSINTVAAVASPAAQTDGCFEVDATVWTNEEAGVLFRESPDPDGAVLQQLAIGTTLVIIDENATVDAEGNLWCLVRYPEAGQTGYVMEEFLAPEEP